MRPVECSGGTIDPGIISSFIQEDKRARRENDEQCPCALSESLPMDVFQPLY